MTWKYTAEYYREYTRTTWNESATAYLDFMRNLEPFRADMVAQLAPRAGEKILDLGTGPGEPALSIAPAVGPNGHVTGVDLSEKMIELATAIGRATDAGNVDFRVMDCARLALPDGAFDGVTSAFGFQIFPEPEQAAREALRVLRPGGRIVAAVWGVAERVPALNVIIAPMLAHAEPDENGYLPTPFELGGPGEMVELLKGAGFRSAEEVRVQHSMRSASAEAYLDSILQATPIGHSLSEETPEVRADVLRETRKNLERWRRPDGIELPAEGVLITGWK